MSAAVFDVIRGTAGDGSSLDFFRAARHLLILSRHGGDALIQLGLHDVVGVVRTLDGIRGGPTDGDGDGLVFRHFHGLTGLRISWGLGIGLAGVSRKVSGVVGGECCEQTRHVADFRAAVGSAGGVAPQADHGADRLHDVGTIAIDCRAGNLLDTGLRGCNGIASGVASLSAQDIVPSFVGIDDLETLVGQYGGRAGRVTGIAGRPIADQDILIELNTVARGRVVVINAVIERHGGHVRGIHQPSNLIDIGRVLIILAVRNQLRKARAIILIAAHIEVRAALAGKVSDVLLEHSLGKCHGGGVGDINRCSRTVIRTRLLSQAVRRVQDCIHMTRRIHQRDDLNALAVRIADDGFHLSLGQRIPIWVIIVRLVARLDTGLHRVARERTVSTVNAVAEAHILQQEAQAVVADRQFQVVIIVILKRINDILDLAHGEILSAAIQMENLH